MPVNVDQKLVFQSLFVMTDVESAVGATVMVDVTKEMSYELLVLDMLCEVPVLVPEVGVPVIEPLLDNDVVDDMGCVLLLVETVPFVEDVPDLLEGRELVLEPLIVPLVGLVPELVIGPVVELVVEPMVVEL